MSATRPSFRLTLVPGAFAIGRLPADAPLPSHLDVAPFCSVVRTAHELSVICPESAWTGPSEAPIERGWSLLRVEGDWPFSAVGVLASLAGPLAEAGISIFAVSTFRTDYLLVKRDTLASSAQSLRAAGHRVDLAHLRIAETPEQVEAVRTLFLAYAESLGFSLCFQGFDQELATLPGAYGPPRGRLLLAESDGAWVGCVGLRDLGDGVCEMKRLYVAPNARGLGLGRQLAEAVIAEARLLGYQRMRLDTIPNMDDARRLYQSLGFVAIAPYCPNPIPGAIYLELSL